MKKENSESSCNGILLRCFITAVLILFMASFALAAPTVTDYQPVDGSNAPISTTVRATFSEALDTAFLNNGTFTLSKFVGVKSLAAGSYFSLALKNDGTVIAWGRNDWGQTTVPENLAGVTAVAAGGQHAVALKSDGTVVAWGRDYEGQISVPADLTGVIAIAAGGYHTVALKSNGTVVAWGQNNFGQTTVPAGLSGVIAIAAGDSHTVALKSDGTVVAWGSNGFGESTSPSNLTGVVAITAGYAYTVALKNDGTVVVWGYTDNGQTTVPPGLSGVTAIAAGSGHPVVLKNDGTVVSWGLNSYGQADVPDELSGVISIAAGAYHTLALKYDGTVVAWGNNQYDQTRVPVHRTVVAAIAAGADHNIALKNDGTVVAWGIDRHGEVVPPGGLSGISAVAIGFAHTVALKTDGTLIAWGSNASGQTTIPSGLSGVTAIAAGDSHTAALKNDGTVVAWGWNDYGQTNVPTGLSGVTAIAAGWAHTVALKSDGTVVAWGDNSFGQATVPAGLTGVIAISAGLDHTVALKSDGSVVAWGDDSFGQSTIPSGLSGVKAVAAGGFHTLALLANGTVVAWGEDSFDQSTVPSGLFGVTAIAAGEWHSIALKNDGTVAAWGDNTYGQSTSPQWLSAYEALVSGSFVYDPNMHNATFTPAQPLTSGKEYYADVTGIRDLSGAQLQIPVRWSFMAVDPELLVAPMTHDFGSVTVNTTSISKSFTITNPTSASLVVSGITLVGNNPGEFSVAPGTCSSLTPVITVGGNCTLNVFFAPTTPGVRSASLHVVSNYSVNPIVDVPLSGNATAQMYPLTITSTGTGSGTISYSTGGTCTGNCSESFANGALVVLTPHAASGSAFSGWTGCDSVNGDQCNVSMTQARSVIAAFASVPTVIAYTPGNGSSAPTSTSVQATFSEPLLVDSIVPAHFTLSRFAGVTAISARCLHTVAVKNNGTVAAWGENDYGQNTVPSALASVIAVAAGDNHTVALKSDGTVVAWGDNSYGQTSVPANLSGVIAIAAGWAHTVALKNDGTVVAWGLNIYGQTTVPAGLSGVTAIAAGDGHTVALKSDGTVVAWGLNVYGEATVPVSLSGIKAIAAGDGHTVVLKNDGTVVAWGNNSDGQATVPTGLTGVKSIAAGGWHTVALKNDGTVVSWGMNVFGQTSVPAGLSGVTAIAAGLYHTVAMKTGGIVVSWGDNDYGQSSDPIGIGAYDNPVSGSLSYNQQTLTVTFTPSTPLATGFTHIATVSGIQSQGGLPLAAPVRWSFITSVTDATAPSSSILYPASTIQLTGTMSAISGTASDGLGVGVQKVEISTDGGITWHLTTGTTSWDYTWTLPINGQYTIKSRATDNAGNVEVPGSGISLTVANTLASYITSPQIGATLSGTSYTITGAITSSAGIQRVEVSTDGGVTWNSATGTTNWSYTWTLPTNGYYTLKSRAIDNAGNVEIPTNAVAVTLANTPISTITAPLSGTILPSAPFTITGSSTSTSAVQRVEVSTDGGVSWHVATGTTNWSYSWTPVGYGFFTLLARATDAVGNIQPSPSVIAIIQDPAWNVFGWGSNQHGQLAEIPSGYRGVPQSVLNLTDVVTVASGKQHTVVLKTDGTVWAWGGNNYGELGDGTVIDRYVPAPVPGLTNVIAIATGFPNTTVLKSDGTVWTWGRAETGSSGSLPTQVPELTTVVAIAPGDNNSIALKSDGTVWTWLNFSGDTGVPATQIPGLSNVIAIATGSQFNIALKADGTVWKYSASGLDQVSGLADIVAIAAGPEHSVALKNNGTVWTWGTDYNGDASYHYTPTLVPDLRNIAAISAGGNHTVVLKANGTVWAWGLNQYGQLGDGSTIDRYSPVMVSGLFDVSSVSAGYRHTFALKSLGPMSYISTPDNGVNVPGAPITISGTAVDNLGATITRVEISTDGGQTWSEATGTDSWSYTWAPTTLGSYTIICRAVDALGKTEILWKKMSVTAVNPSSPAWEWGKSPATNAVRALPEQFAELNGVVEISRPAAKSDVVIALKGDGTLWSKGSTDQNFSLIPGMTTVKTIASGAYYSLAVKTDGSVWGWGANDNGVLGYDRNFENTLPVLIPGLNNVTAIAAGNRHAMALKNDGTVWTWGANVSGQLGNGTTTGRFAPGQVNGISNVIAIAAAGDQSFALRADGTVWAWGQNQYGQLGDGTFTDRYVPQQVPGINAVIAVTAGVQHTAVLQSDGTVWTWGANDNGALGDGTRTGKNVPGQVPGISSVVGVAAGSGHTVVLKADGTVWAWGRNISGQIGDSTTIDRMSPVEVIGLTGVKRIAAYNEQSAAYYYSSRTSTIITPTNGSAIPRGESFTINGLADPMDGPTVQAVEVSTDGGQTWASATGTLNWTFTWVPAESGSHIVRSRAINSNGLAEIPEPGVTIIVPEASGTLWTWGANASGELGDGTTTDKISPMPLSAISGTITDIAAGAEHAVALNPDGTVWSWGSNYSGQLGDGTTNDRHSPALIEGLNGVSAVAAGGIHTIVLKNDGTLWSWGANYSGQLGDGTTTDRFSPGQVSGLSMISAIATGYDHNVALKSDGTVWTWGSNFSGQLGDGTTTERYVPDQVSGLSGIIAVAASGSHTVALKSNGTVWAWGANFSGQLGDGTTSDSSIPIMIPDLTGVTAIVAGNGYTIALKSDGTVWSWGTNDSGQLGDGTVNDRYTPSQVSAVDSVAGIAGGYGHVLAFKVDGTVWGWGSDTSGQLGFGGRGGFSPLPVQAAGLMKIKKVAAGSEFSMALQSGTPHSFIASPNTGAILSGTLATVTGSAIAEAETVVQKVEISTDGGVTWHLATGTTSWSFSWVLPPNGQYEIKSRATDNFGTSEFPGAGVMVTVNNTLSSAITAPQNSEVLSGAGYTIRGTATSSSLLQRVEVSTDGGITWNVASGTTTWSYDWTLPPGDQFTIRSRAVDVCGNVEIPSAGVTVTPIPLSTIPVRISRQPYVSYVSLQTAYNDATSGDIVQIKAVSFTEDLFFARDVTVTMRGGYDDSFVGNTMQTTINGMMRVTLGTVKVENLRFR